LLHAVQRQILALWAAIDVVRFHVFKAMLAIAQSTVEMRSGDRLDNPGAGQHDYHVGENDPELDIGRRA
jgi:hypothetical protein